ncbi:protein cueball isoform X2 [Planococcus citri]|uniref:protein cueball isoform X2 n=1 Tax=Planococcus citri TaxID=170843 RepID=UPI0031F7FB1C
MPIVKFSIGWFILPVFLVTSWDVAVITNEDIQFLQQGNFVSIASQHLKDLASGSYDPVRGDLYVSDSNHQNASVFKISTFNSNYDTGFIPIASKQQSIVEGIVFDPVNSALFWSTGHGRTINKLNVNHTVDSKNTQSGVILHSFADEIPLGIAVDSCRQYLYWTNCNILKPSIERSRTDGSDREAIITKDLSQPLGIVVDQQAKLIYWTDGREGIYFSIERSDLNGGNRLIIYHGTDHDEPRAITLAGNFIYWIERTERNLWALPKNKTTSDAPQQVQKFGSKIPIGVISNTLYIDTDPNECQLPDQLREKIEKNYKYSQKLNLHGTIHDLTIISESTSSSNGNGFCLNNGTTVANGCKCRRGYSGPRCEISVCHNYCIRGSCKVDQDSNPNCYCPTGYSGSRCEIDKCHGMCLNSGSCIVNEVNQVTCVCKSGYSGDRCEFLNDVKNELCKTYCQFSESNGVRMQSSTSAYGDDTGVDSVDGQARTLMNLCSCSEENKLSSVSDRLERLADEADSRNQNQHIVPELSSRLNVLVTSTLAILCIILVISVIYLSTKVYVLRKRPRIRKRIVVNKPLAPITCRPQSPPDQCEITIENCCNMNICETVSSYVV